MYKKNISFVIFTYNEEDRIERVIKNFMDYGNIIIADNESSDRTREIAESYGCNILIRNEDYGFVETQQVLNMVTDAVSTDWIYWGYADEMLSKTTLEEIQRIVDGDEYDIINIIRKNYFFGKFCYDAFASRGNRIFKKEAISFSNNRIHHYGRAIVPQDRIYRLPSHFFIHHFISNTARSYLDAINKYTEVELLFPDKPKNIILMLVAYPFLMFVNNFIRKKGFKAGIAGLTLIFFMIIYHIVKIIKLYEESNELNILSIENSNNNFRDKILENFELNTDNSKSSSR